MLVLILFFVRVAVVTNHLMYQIMIPYNFLLILLLFNQGTFNTLVC